MDHLKVTLTLGKPLGALKSIKGEMILSGAVCTALRFGCMPLDCNSGASCLDSQAKSVTVIHIGHVGSEFWPGHLISK